MVYSYTESRRVAPRRGVESYKPLSVVEVARDYGGVDVMVNKARIIERGPLFDVTEASICVTAGYRA